MAHPGYGPPGGMHASSSGVIPEHYRQLQHIQLKLKVGGGDKTVKTPVLEFPDSAGVPMTADIKLPERKRFASIATEYAGRILSMDES